MPKIIKDEVNEIGTKVFCSCFTPYSRTLITQDHALTVRQELLLAAMVCMADVMTSP